MTTLLPLNFNTWSGAALGWHIGRISADQDEFIKALDDFADGDHQVLAEFILDDALNSEEYDPILDLFFEDELTDDDWELVGQYTRDDRMLDMLIGLLKNMEGGSRLIFSQNNPTIDDI